MVIEQTVQEVAQPVSEIMYKFNFDYTDIAMLIIGALIGLVSSITIIIVERLLDKHGKLRIYYKFSNQIGAAWTGWGFDEGQGDRLYFCVPVVYEIQNTSNVTRVIRDLSLWLYDDNKKVAKMVQVERHQTTIKERNATTEEQEIAFGSEKGSYSFVIQPRSIQRQKCEYITAIDSNEIDNYKFNFVKATFYDESGKQKCFTIRAIDNCWELKRYAADKEWAALNDRKNRSRL